MVTQLKGQSPKGRLDRRGSKNYTPYYHCIARCVRRAFLCGVDDFSGRDYEHRRQWIIDKLRSLAGVFANDICAYVVMSNHYHAVLRVDEHTAQHWQDSEVIERWTTLFSAPVWIQRHLKGEPPPPPRSPKSIKSSPSGVAG